MLKIGPDGRLQRIEYRGKYLRMSRTGGVALRAQTKAAGINFTANSAHGLRASTRVAKGTQVAFQNGRFVLRGRYGEGPTKLNLSKSGVSVSTKTEIGTVNWFKPRYSSAKIGGIHVRGKNAIYLHLLVGVLSLLAYIAIAVVQVTVVILQALYWLTLQGGLQVQRLWATRHQATIEATEARWLSELSIKDADWLQTGIEWILLDLGQGKSWSAEAAAANTPSAELALYLADSRLPQPLDLELMLGCLAERYEALAGETACLELFLDLDSAAVAAGGRNQLQERLLAAYAGCCGIDVARSDSSSHH